MGVVGSKLLFKYDDGTHGKELWSTTGLKSGTLQAPVMVKDINPQGDSLLVSDYFDESWCMFKGKLFFQATDGVNGWSLWRSDGTSVDASTPPTHRQARFPLPPRQPAATALPLPRASCEADPRHHSLGPHDSRAGQARRKAP